MCSEYFEMCSENFEMCSEYFEMCSGNFEMCSEHFVMCSLFWLALFDFVMCFDTCLCSDTYRPPYSSIVAKRGIILDLVMSKFSTRLKCHQHAENITCVISLIRIHCFYYP
jgi:hypothetical protein